MPEPTEPGATPTEPIQSAEPNTTEEPFDRERALSTIRSQREAEKQLKERVRALEADLAAGKDAQKKLEDIEREQMSETEKAKAEAEEANKRLAEIRHNAENANLRAALATAETKVVDHEVVADYLRSRGEVQFDESGSPTNLQEALEKLLESKPALKAQAPQTPTTNAAAGSGGQPEVKLTSDELAMAQTTGTDPTRYAALRREPGDHMTYDEWAATQGSK